MKKACQAGFGDRRAGAASWPYQVVYRLVAKVVSLQGPGWQHAQWTGDYCILREPGPFADASLEVCPVPEDKITPELQVGVKQ